LTRFEKFTSESDEEKIRNKLALMRDKEPNRIPYVIGASKHTGYFYIYYMPGKKLKHERIGVTKGGYVFIKQEYSSPTQLINAFKKSFQDSGNKGPERTSTTPRPLTPQSDRRDQW
jgi:hypothetical protein